MLFRSSVPVMRNRESAQPVAERPVTVATSRQNSSMPPRLHRLYNRLGRWSVFTWIPSYKVISRQTFEKALAPDRARKGAEERRVGPRGGVLGGRPVRKGGL